MISVLRERLNEDVVAVVTSAALRFISIDVLRYAGRAAAVVTDSSDSLSDQPNHIWLAEQMSGLLVYPASANFIGRAAVGMADDTASLTFLASHKKPRMIAPSMNHLMWINPLVQKNIASLQHYGVSVVPPVGGFSRDVTEVVDAYCSFVRDSLSS